jgi:hypothetical protein
MNVTKNEIPEVGSREIGIGEAITLSANSGDFKLINPRRADERSVMHYSSITFRSACE